MLAFFQELARLNTSLMQGPEIISVSNTIVLKRYNNFKDNLSGAHAFECVAYCLSILKLKRNDRMHSSSVI